MPLVAYDSSDEDSQDEGQQVQAQKADQTSVHPQETANATTSIDIETNGNGSAKPHEIQPELKSTSPTQQEAAPPQLGPAVGPVMPEASTLYMEQYAEDDQEALVSRSPYAANRALLRVLTMPTIPNFDIPPSPPGSPPPSTERKFLKFLELKKKGKHLNESLSQSSSMKNPSFTQKQMAFAGITTDEQYASTLPSEFWHPPSLPKWAHKEELARQQDKITKKREQEKLGNPRGFVPASSSPMESGSGIRGGPQSAAERIMAGLDRGRSGSPQVSGLKRKSRFDT